MPDAPVEAGAEQDHGADGGGGYQVRSTLPAKLTVASTVRRTLPAECDLWIEKQQFEQAPLSWPQPPQASGTSASRPRVDPD
jgi:hypothetical protein